MIKTRVYNPEEEKRDLGFGSLLSERHDIRLLNPDGSFNVLRQKRSWWKRLASYEALINLSWPRFAALVTAYYVFANAAFGLVYWLLGPGALAGDAGVLGYWRAFFFSVDTFATIGYGNLTPFGIAANVLVTFESLIGLLSVALVTGLLFARFARPHAEIIYSVRSLVAPYRGITAWEFRIVNARESQLIDLQVKVVLSRFEMKDGMRVRRYTQLALERDGVGFFPLAWTIVHPIDELSPLYGATKQQLLESQAEFVILLTAIDETYSQTVHSRTSYRGEEIIWGARFAQIFKDDGTRVPKLDLNRFHAYELVPLPAPAVALSS